jgi:hypothetical protein
MWSTLSLNVLRQKRETELKTAVAIEKIYMGLCLTTEHVSSASYRSVIEVASVVVNDFGWRIQAFAEQLAFCFRAKAATLLIYPCADFDLDSSFGRHLTKTNMYIQLTDRHRCSSDRRCGIGEMRCFNEHRLSRYKKIIRTEDLLLQKSSAFSCL